MGAGNPGPGAGIGQPGVEQAQPANLNPGVHPAPPEFPIYIKEEIRYLTLKTEIAESSREADGVVRVRVLEPASFSTKEIEFAIFGFAGQLNLRLVHRSRKVNVVTLSSVISRNQSARFLLSPLDTGNPGEPAAILRFESVERMPPPAGQEHIGRPGTVQNSVICGAEIERENRGLLVHGGIEWLSRSATV